MAVIDANHLWMKFGTTVAVRDVSFGVGEREVVGFLGPNAAGKTTTMRILNTHIVPTDGTASVGGFDVLKQPLEVRRVVGYLPEQAPLYHEMEVAEYLEFAAQARWLKGVNKKLRIDWVVEKCGLESVYRRPIAHLSKGFRQRTGLAQALIHDPAVLILDEPTVGLDPVQIIGIRKLIRDLAAEKTIILSTHILTEAAAVSDRLVIIDKGAIVADGTVAELYGRVRKPVFTRLTVKGARAKVKIELEALAGVKSARCRAEEGEFVTFELRSAPGGDVTGVIARLVHEKGWLVRELTELPLDLEKTFLSLVDTALS